MVQTPELFRLVLLIGLLNTTTFDVVVGVYVEGCICAVKDAPSSLVKLPPASDAKTIVLSAV